MRRKVFALLALLVLVGFGESGLAVRAQDGETVLILPFESTSGQREYNWVGESFADSLTSLLETPGLSSISNDERALIYQKLRLPLTTIPSKATAIKIGQQARATILVTGKYEISPADPSRQTIDSIVGTAKIIRISEGRMSGERRLDGGWSSNSYDFGGPLKDLQLMQGRLAFQMLYDRDNALPFSMNQFVERATVVPPRAFEAYVKGIMTDDLDKRSSYFQNALREYSKARPSENYPQALFELGSQYYRLNNWQLASDYLSRIQRTEPHYAEAAFLSALSFWKLNDTVRALGTLIPLTTEAPLTGVYNNAGAMALEAAKRERTFSERQALLKQSLDYLSKARQSSANDPMVAFNVGYTLFLSERYKEASDAFALVTRANDKDGDAWFLQAKSLEKLNASSPEAAVADNQARLTFPPYAKLQTAWLQGQQLPDIPVRMREAFNLDEYITAVHLQESNNRRPSDLANPQEIMNKARELYAAGYDDDALVELRRVLTLEPMNADAYLVIGRINLRRGDLDPAISALKTAVFWDSRQIDAHILLGRIFLERGDRAQAVTYSQMAMTLDPNNQEAIGLKRQIEVGGK